MNALSHRLVLPGIYNLRHVGGYATLDGRAIRPYALFRSDSLHRLSPEGQARLLGYGLRAVIDLRRKEEIIHEPNLLARLPQIDYRNLSLYDNWREVMPDGPPESVLEMYQNIVDRCQAAIGQVLCTAATGPFPLLIHCKVGKDRTGIIVALLLAALGIPQETIIADYTESQANLQPLLPELMSAAATAGFDLQRYSRLLQSPPEAMTGLLAHFDQQYGGVNAYLDTCGFTSTSREQLRANWLTNKPAFTVPVPTSANPHLPHNDQNGVPPPE